MKKQQMDLNGLPYTLKILAENTVRNDPMQENCWNNWSKKWLADRAPLRTERIMSVGIRSASICKLLNGTDFI